MVVQDEIRIQESSINRAFSSSLLRAVIARNHLSFFKIFSNFVYFCQNFQICCPFFPFFNMFLPFFRPFSEKLHACPYFLEQTLFNQATIQCIIPAWNTMYSSDFQAFVIQIMDTVSQRLRQFYLNSQAAICRHLIWLIENNWKF